MSAKSSVAKSRKHPPRPLRIGWLALLLEASCDLRPCWQPLTVKTTADAFAQLTAGHTAAQIPTEHTDNRALSVDQDRQCSRSTKSLTSRVTKRFPGVIRRNSQF